MLFQSVVRNGSVSLPPFIVRPSVLELMKGESGVIEVIFSPPSVKSYKQEMTLVCDNCHVQHFTLEGTSPFSFTYKYVSKHACALIIWHKIRIQSN